MTDSLTTDSLTADSGTTRSTHGASLAAMMLAALGVVFGDIGTSPLYTFKIVMDLGGDMPDPKIVLGSLSLIIWTLIAITTVKYVGFAMRVDNDGEGGILALMSLLGVKLRPRPVIVAVSLMGAALIYGDGAITPAISVLSALEGLDMAEPALASYVLPLALLVLAGLFAFQSRGTARIGKTFGPLMALWFAVIGLLGLHGIYQHPAILAAFNPLYGFSYLLSDGQKAFLLLGGVFLCVTGAEALYADMGHFGARPIRYAWLWLVFPCLVLNYAGQAALVLEGAPLSDNIFYRLCPPSLLKPFIGLATVATVIASQAVITGAFSMTRQAIQLGWLPRMQVTQTSEEEYGQIYVGLVNWLLMIVTVSLAIGFGKSDHLAAAYGIAVSATMLATTGLLYIAMREIWKWSLVKAASVASLFAVIDATFFAANLNKFAEGGFVPVVMAAIIYGIMLTWHKGNEVVNAYLHEAMVPIDKFMAEVERDRLPRVPGVAVFLTRTDYGTPPVILWHVRQNRVLHEQVFILKVATQSVPWVKNAEKLAVQALAPNVWRAVASYGFMEIPNIPKLLKRAHAAGCPLNLADVTYYVGHETVISRDDGKGLPRPIELLYTFMRRNALDASQYFQLPADNVVEIGRRVDI